MPYFGHLPPKIISKLGMLCLNRQDKKEVTSIGGINRSTEQKLQRSVHHIRGRQEETKAGDLSFL